MKRYYDLRQIDAETLQATVSHESGAKDTVTFHKHDLQHVHFVQLALQAGETIKPLETASAES